MKRRLSDTCSLCDAPVWQYADDGKSYCEAHARWKQIGVERMRHPLDELHNRASVQPERLQRATKMVTDIIQRIGYAEALWVAEHLAWEADVQWWDSRVIIKLSDLQMVAFAAAMRAHHEALYPRRDEPTKLRASGLDANRAKAKKRSSFL